MVSSPGSAPDESTYRQNDITWPSPCCTVAGISGLGTTTGSAPPGQEPGHVEFALQPGRWFGADGGRARGDLGHDRRRAQVHDHVRAIGQDHRFGAVHA